MGAFKQILFVFVLCFSSILSAELANRPRWIYNRSGATWKLFTKATNIRVDGLVLDISTGVVDTTLSTVTIQEYDDGYNICVVEPGQVVQISYLINHSGSVADQVNGNAIVALIDNAGSYAKYKWAQKSTWNTVEAYILHDGATDAMNLNHPADGDVDIWGDNL